MAILRQRPRWSLRQRLRWIGWRLAGLGILGWAAAPNLSAEAAPAGEYQIKAVFVYNFAHFVQWPPDALPAGPTPLVIGILGTDPFGAYLDEAVRGEKIDGHPLAVQRFARIEDVRDCQILFISQSENDRLDRILGDLKGRSILTVSEAAGFGGRGGMIGLVTVDHKIRLKINVGAARASTLTISSKLLRPAEIVTTGKD
jgi:uncharacterized protein DUF4154